MPDLKRTIDVAGPRSLRTCTRFWEGFTPTAIDLTEDADALQVRLLCDDDWLPVTARITQHDTSAHLSLRGEGDLDAAAVQVARFLSLDVDATSWPDVGRRDPVIGAAQQAMPGFRPCGFHSPYDPAIGAALSQRTRMPIAARLRLDMIARYGTDGAFPSPADLRRLAGSGELDLPGRKAEYLADVAERWRPFRSWAAVHLRAMREEHGPPRG